MRKNPQSNISNFFFIIIILNTLDSPSLYFARLSIYDIFPKKKCSNKIKVNFMQTFFYNQ